MATKPVPLSGTEQCLIRMANELQTKLGLSARDAAMVALCGAVAAVQVGPIEGMRSNIDRDELLAVVDGLGKVRR